MIFFVFIWHPVKIYEFHYVQVIVCAYHRVDDAQNDKPGITRLDTCCKNDNLCHKPSERWHTCERQECREHHQSQYRVATTHPSIVSNIFKTGDAAICHYDAKS